MEFKLNSSSRITNMFYKKTCSKMMLYSRHNFTHRERKSIALGAFLSFFPAELPKNQNQKKLHPHPSMDCFVLF